MERRRSCYISLLRETTLASDPEFSLAPATSGMDGIITVHTRYARLKGIVVPYSVTTTLTISSPVDPDNRMK